MDKSLNMRINVVIKILNQKNATQYNGQKSEHAYQRGNQTP